VEINLLITNLLITNLLITNLLITNLLITNLLITNLMQQTSCNKPHDRPHATKHPSLFPQSQLHFTHKITPVWAQA
jgi:hypothetical protein